MNPGFLLQVDKNKGLFGEASFSPCESKNPKNPWEAYFTKSTGTNLSAKNKVQKYVQVSEGSNVLKKEKVTEKNTAYGPMLPQTLSSPILTLTNWYSSVYKTIQLTSDSYTSWCDEDPHRPHYTCIFRCPRSGEIFLSGRYGDPSHHEVRSEMSNKGMLVEVIWYTKKKLAQHAVAARVLDCYYFRSHDFDLNMSLNLCQEKPYPIDMDRATPISAPEIRIVDTKMNTSDEEGERYRAREKYRKYRTIASD